MSEYTKTALVLGAGGFIGSHMVKRLRSEGYWVRGVDLKYPEYSQSEANEFVTGDLRDPDFVRRVLEFKGEQGNFYNSVPYRYIQTFDEIYQFAADMGGAGFVFTGENDADIMHNSATINLNVLELQRKMNEDKGVNATKIFYSGSACMYPEHNQLDPDIPFCLDYSEYPEAPFSDYGWRNCSQSGCFSLILVIMGSLFGLLGIIISLDQRELGKEVEKKHLQQSVEKLPNFQRGVDPSRCGEMAYKLVPSCILTNASKQPAD